EKAGMVRLDLAVASSLQAHGTEWGESVLLVVSWLGAPALSVLLVGVGVLFVWRRDWRHLAVLAVTCGGGALLNWALKSAFHRERPTFASEFTVHSWSFPSGHAMDSLIGYGLLAYWLARHWPRHAQSVRVAAAAIIGAI